ncbi:hypothetical protein SKAU_G00238250 [Synaphobranchus kaupii]|uniref:Zona pellucida sperm-binding protein 3 n=1 Tax=Synaphobranchus kaupii TaxID=118154 RepID=A0A9Q1F7H6_SYNKA|nr:hypothetical protein SKAU_G00238250 [Synaphobranchus kaupii]
MGGERLCVGLVILSLFGCLCDAQQVNTPSYLNSHGLDTAQWYSWRVTPAPFTARPTIRRPAITQAPLTARPTIRRPAITQAPLTARPTIRRPAITQAPLTARPTIRRPAITQAPLTARPTIRRPAITQAPLTLHPTIGEPKGTTVVGTTRPNPDSVTVQCGEDSIQLNVDVDLLGIGNLIQPSDITLGSCGPAGQDHSRLLFETELHGCDSTLMMTEDTLVYTFALLYQPKALGATPIIRTNAAVVGVQCHYMRLHNVSSNALKPTWIPYHSTLSAEDLIMFSLRLMADDWQLERTSNVFFLGDIINIEASVIQANHVSLRVFMDTCVATLEPNMDSIPSYDFIYDQGCLMDSKLTSSRSEFLSRITDDKLQVKLDAFRFAQETRSQIYIFCHLRATAALPDSEGKACHFHQKGWISASGNDPVCSCCDTGCTVRKGRSLGPAAPQYRGTAFLGPIVVQQPATDIMPESASTPFKAEDNRAAGVSSEALFIAGVVAAVGLVCMIVLVTVLWRRFKPTVL